MSLEMHAITSLYEGNPVIRKHIDDIVSPCASLDELRRAVGDNPDMLLKV